MKRIFKRAMELLALVLVGSILIWSLIYALPGDTATAILGDDATVAEVEQLREKLGLNQSPIVQYFNWAGGALTGDLGNSYVTGVSVWDQVTRRLVPSAHLGVFALIIALVIAIPASVLGSWKPRSAGRFVDIVFSGALAIPSFWIGILLILLCAVYLRILPSVALYVPIWEDPVMSIRFLFLPALSLGIFAAGIFGRFLRSSLTENMSSDFVRAARARGMNDLSVIIFHALRNSLLPLITVVALRAGALFGGSMVIEAVFNFPGFGRLILQAVTSRDYLLVQGSLLIVLVIFAVLNLLTDALYLVADPRARREAAAA